MMSLIAQYGAAWISVGVCDVLLQNLVPPGATLYVCAWSPTLLPFLMTYIVAEERWLSGSHQTRCMHFLLPSVTASLPCCRSAESG